GANLLITSITAGGTQTATYYLSNLTVGKLYKLAVVIADGTGAWGAGDLFKIQNNAKTINIAAMPSGITAGTDGLIWEATETNNCVVFITNLANTETLNITSIYVDEVQPGCVGADYLGPDGWSKLNTFLDSVFRESTIVKDGANYSVKIVGGDNWSGFMYPDIVRYIDKTWYQKFKGKTVTFGAWVKTSDSNVRLLIHTSHTNTTSSYHTGGGDWEWLEITATVETNTTDFHVRVWLFTGEVAYMSQPMLVFGSYIGEGNYGKPMGEILYLENPTGMVNFDGDAYSTVAAWTSINIEAETSGKIGKDISALQLTSIIKDSGSAGATMHFKVTGDSAYTFNEHMAQKLASDAYTNDNWTETVTTWLRTNTAGDVYYKTLASGESTLDIYCTPVAVQLR
ncbi:hypothetical protein KAR91_74505, partial [Candidatus Pacearchaeota archaeon]|nr:hypothetical protein [Candidatus Pacearchaeota archaeon]